MYTRRTDQRYMADFDIDRERVGPLMAQGRQHSIYAYGESHVIKIPQRSLYMQVYGGFSYPEILAEVQLLENYLPQFIPKTEVLSTSQHEGYVVVQERLTDFEWITPHNVLSLTQEFGCIMTANRAIEQRHAQSLDLLGNRGLQASMLASLVRQPQRAFMNNVFLVKQGGQQSVKIVDFNLLHIGGQDAHVSLFRRMVDQACFVVSRRLLKDNFNLEM